MIFCVGFEDRYANTNNSDPRCWDQWQTQMRLKQLSEKVPFNYDSFIDIESGETLCQMNMEHFLQRDPVGGGDLYNEVQQLLYMQHYVPQPNYYPNFPTDFAG